MSFPRHCVSQTCCVSPDIEYTIMCCIVNQVRVNWHYLVCINVLFYLLGFMIELEWETWINSRLPRHVGFYNWFRRGLFCCIVGKTSDRHGYDFLRLQNTSHVRCNVIYLLTNVWRGNTSTSIYSHGCNVSFRILSTYGGVLSETLKGYSEMSKPNNSLYIHF